MTYDKGMPQIMGEVQRNNNGVIKARATYALTTADL
jgi:hypothetical protein